MTDQQTNAAPPILDRMVDMAGARRTLKLTTERVIAFEDLTGIGIFTFIEQVGDSALKIRPALLLLELMAGLNPSGEPDPDHYAVGKVHGLIGQALTIAIHDLGLEQDAPDDAASPA